MSPAALVAAFRGGARPSFDDCVAALRGLFPWLDRFRDTPQDPEWHAEGDVHVHCAMVLDELYAVLGETDLPLTDDERASLFLGAILHDIAKPVTTTVGEVRGVVRTLAPKHEERGRAAVAQGLLELGQPYGVVRDVMALVGYHQVPKLLVAKGREDAAFRNLARKAPAHLLYLLEQADMRGRICPDREEQLLYLDLFRERCEQLGVWRTRPYADWADEIGLDGELRDRVIGQAIRDHEGGVVATAGEGAARGFAARQGFARLYVLVGPSGSGKSTWASRHVPGATVISLDDLREEIGGDRSDQRKNGEVRQEATRRLKRALAAHEAVVYDATNLRRDFRGPLVQAALDYGALATLVVVHRRTASILAGNKGREHAVASSVLQDQLDRWQFPEEDEAHRVLVVGDDGVVHRAGFWS